MTSYPGYLTSPIGRVYETINALGSISGAQNIDFSLGGTMTCTINGATTFSFANAVSGYNNVLILFITNGSTNVTWPGGINWGSSGAPTLSASGVDIFMFTTLNGGTTVYASQVLKGG